MLTKGKNGDDLCFTCCFISRNDFFYHKKTADKIKVELQYQAAKRNGQIDGSSFLLAYPGLKFDHEGSSINVNLSPGGKHSPPTCSIHCHLFLTIDPEIELFPKRFFGKLNDSFRSQYVKAGSNDFNAKFLMKAKKADVLRNLLTPDIEKIFESFIENGLRFSIKQKKLIFRIHSIPKERADYDRFIDGTLHILDRVKTII